MAKYQRVLDGLVTREGTGASKLTDNGVREIKSKIAKGATDRALAKEYGVHPKTIYSIRTGFGWKHIKL